MHYYTMRESLDKASGPREEDGHNSAHVSVCKTYVVFPAGVCHSSLVCLASVRSIDERFRTPSSEFVVDEPQYIIPRIFVFLRLGMNVVYA